MRESGRWSLDTARRPADDAPKAARPPARAGRLPVSEESGHPAG